MATCFVIQPFDGGKYDARYEDIFVPAIKGAGLEPYRTDLDPSVSVPIEAVENGIRDSAVCLADITTDNPNVWYELGYAFAVGIPVVMVCGDERTGKYPFDIQHRTVIPYKAHAPRDFEKLQQGITKRIQALTASDKVLRRLSDAEQVAPLQGLTQPELAILAAIAGELFLPDSRVAVYRIKRETERAGFTAIGFSMGVRRLTAKAFIVQQTIEDEEGHPYDAFGISEEGWDWIEQNEDNFRVRKPDPLDEF